MEKTRIGIIGCGVISNTYIHDIINYYTDLELVACADVVIEAARKKAREYEIAYACTVDEILGDPSISVIINLTPPRFHSRINRQILEAGKHVFCEKPFALSVDEAEEVIALAREKGLYIGCAPDTFLGASLQTGRKLLEDGWIGKPLYVTANMMSCGVETWHPSPEFFYQEGGGPLLDMGPYYITALVTYFGPIAKLWGISAKGFSERTIYSKLKRGTKIPVEIPTHYTAMLEMQSGVLVSMNLSFDVWYSTLPKMEIYGTEGTLIIPDPNMSGGRPQVYRREQVIDAVYDESESAAARREKPLEVPEVYHRLTDYTRGQGVLEMVQAIQEKRKNRANEEIALHVTEAMTGLMEASRTGRAYQMRTTCEKPEALPLGRTPGKI